MKSIWSSRNSGFALFGIAQSYAEEGDEEMAIEAYILFLDAWPEADRDLPQVIIAVAAIRTR